MSKKMPKVRYTDSAVKKANQPAVNNRKARRAAKARKGKQ